MLMLTLYNDIEDLINLLNVSINIQMLMLIDINIYKQQLFKVNVNVNFIY